LDHFAFYSPIVQFPHYRSTYRQFTHSLIHA
jgi:hypothetical protein